MQAICEGDLDLLESYLKHGWPINDPVDHDKKFNAATLACHLDKLEVLHLLDLYGADLNQGVGKFNNTPLMAALSRWNVRIIDYLMERGVDPTVKDNFGFTALRKAEIRNLRTISSMLKAYEDKYAKMKKPIKLLPITNEYWVRQIKLLNVALTKKNKNHVPLVPLNFTRTEIWRRDNQISKFRPSDLLIEGEYPLADL